MLHSREVRQQIRQGNWRKPTAGLAPGFVQANLVVLPRDLAYDFLVFAQRNPKPCPVIEVTDAGSPEPRLSAPEADLRTDVPRYRVYRQGEVAEEVTDLLGVWGPDLVAFLLGCSFTFEAALLQAGVPVRHIEEGKNVPMFVTSVPCVPAGMFRGPLVVTMRPIPAPLVSRAVQVSGRYPGVHGSPVHLGDPAAIGIRDLARPDFGDPVTIHPGEVPVFWACGVTPQAVAMQVRPSLMLTHAPGHMFVTDLRNEELAAV
ncbi:MAG TPA: putative hydro-lyase [Candidatus Methylomirabilis sp.]|nr:putative hydro-lyase [Candidatus Methylomirabilis sp.]HSC72171.1 putative hydro-lyase [Candidatus Methylomirabilis sp.]